ncbi:MAG: S1/P1 nuclease [Candidatus Azotimanducaceae bacterium WSBS_2022_MAG_OTU7]
MPFRLVFSSLFLLLVSFNAQAWGWDGHRLVCDLAQAKLTPGARMMVNTLLAEGEALEGGQVSFPESCLWPDNVKHSNHKGSYEQHFINVPDEALTVDLLRDCAALNCIATGIQKALTYLSQPAESDREKARQAAALRFLGHFIGDLHQPLHIGNASDRGGNRVSVQWQGKKTNLHALWDYGMLESIGIKYPESVDFLMSVEKTSDDKHILNWINESLALGRSNAYADAQGKIIATGDSLGSDYLERNKPILIERLVLASERLATLLNEIAAGKQPRAFLLVSP